MTGFKIPLDAFIVAVPTLYAIGALTGLVVKTLTADPEMSTINYYEKDEKEIAKGAQHWNDGVKEIFRQRINKHKFGFFNNEFDFSEHK